MRIPIEKESGVPLYQQIGSHLRQAIMAGRLPAGTRLPAARRLAADLGVSRITVETAYADLEADGLVVRQMGSGSYVLPIEPISPGRGSGAREWPAWQRAAVRGAVDTDADARAHAHAHARAHVSYAVTATGTDTDVGPGTDASTATGTGTNVATGTDTDIGTGVEADIDTDTDVDIRADIAPWAASPVLPQGTISFTGFGDPRLFRMEEFSTAIRQVLRRDGTSSLHVDDPRGYGPLRASVAHILTSQGVDADPGNVLITSGSQQGISLVVQLLIRAGETVVTENPTYDGALRLFRAQGARVIVCPTDARGMQVEALEEILQKHRPKLIYTIPNFQNPTGASLSIPRRRALVALADRYNVPILEDDFVGDLRYEGQIQPALKAFDPGGRVIYAGTFSKLLMPGLRVGFLVVEGPVYRCLAELKSVNDLWTATLFQRALESYVTVGRYHAHLRRLCRVYRRRRDQMVEAVQRYLPGCAPELVPQGGLFLWVRLPERVSALELLPLARRHGVDFTPGDRFFPRPDEGKSFVRLNFAVATPEEIDEGMRRLGRALERLVARVP